MHNKKNRSFIVRDDETIFEMLRLFNNLETQFRPITESMTRNYNMTVSRLQWKPEWKEALELAGRAANAYNLLRPVINVIASIEVGNRKRVVAKPTRGGSAELANVITKVLLYYFHKTKFDWDRTRATIDAIIAGYAVYYWGWSYENDEVTGELECGTVDPRTVMYELNYSDPTWEKTNYIMRKHQLSLEEILNKYSLNDPEMTNILLEEAKTFIEQDTEKRDKWISKKLKALMSAAFEVAVEGHNRTESALNSRFMQWFNPLTGKFDVLELHEKRTERRLLIFDRGREKMIDITEESRDPRNPLAYDNEKISLIKQEYGIDGEPEENLDNKRFVTAVIPALRAKVNEQPYPFKSRTFCYIPQHCYDYHADAEHAQSVIDDLVDPQSDFNKARSTKLELLTRYINNGYIMEEGAIIGVEEDWTTNRLAPYRRVRTGYISKVKPEERQTISPDLIQELGEAPQLIEYISNAGRSIRGEDDRNVKSAKHFNAKTNREEKSFSYIFSHVDLATKTGWEYGLALIQNSITVPMAYQITHDTPEPYELKVNQKQLALEHGKIVVKIVNDITIGKYSVEIDTVPYTANAREIEFEKMGELYTAVREVNEKRANAMLPIMVKAGGYPYAQEILEAWRAEEGGSPEQQKLEQMMMMIQEIMLKLGVDEKKQDVIGKALDNEIKKEELKRAKTERVMNVLHPEYGQRAKKKLAA